MIALIMVDLFLKLATSPSVKPVGHRSHTVAVSRRNRCPKFTSRSVTMDSDYAMVGNARALPSSVQGLEGPSA